MAIGRSSNPALRDAAFRVAAPVDGATMTVDGAVNRSLILLALVLGGVVAYGSLLGAGLDRSAGFESAARAIGPWIVLAAFAAFGVGLVTILDRGLSPWTAPLYAVVEGFVLGGVSDISELRYPGVVLPAVSLTIGVFVAMLAVYKSRLIAVTQNFMLGLAAAIGGILVVYLATAVAGLFGVALPLLHEAVYGSGWLGIGFSVVVIVVAALNLVLDFDFIERGAENGAPKYMEWYAAFGLMVTLIWLYLEILRLMTKLSSRR